MIAEHPAVLSLFEFFTGLSASERFAADPISGAQLAELIAREQPFVTAVLRRGYRVEEITYPFADGSPSATGAPFAAGAPFTAGAQPASEASDATRMTGRFRRSDPLPWILVSMLPRLDADPDALFDDLMRYAEAMPEQRPHDHYRQLFSWLCERYGRALWVERSGSSIDYAASLISEFPEARFVHIHRAGAEVALSMRNHHAYRLPIALIYDMPLEDGRRVSELPPLDFDATPTPEDTISRILSARPPPEHFARYWSDQMVRGAEAFASLDASRLLVVRFEDLVRDPRPILESIADFFALEDNDGQKTDVWMERAAGLIRGVPPTRTDELDAESRARLDDACLPGRDALQRICG